MWFEFFYRTAMREQEVMHVSWSDIDFERSTITVRENKRFGWKPKAYKGRYIRNPCEPAQLCSKPGRKSRTRPAVWFSRRQAANRSRIFWMVQSDCKACRTEPG